MAVIIKGILLSAIIISMVGIATAIGSTVDVTSRGVIVVGEFADLSNIYVIAGICISILSLILAGVEVNEDK